MNALLRIGVVGLLAAGASACAGTQHRVAATPLKNVDPDLMVVDTAYVAHVERSARSRGALIRWVNAPVKRAGTPRQ